MHPPWYAHITNTTTSIEGGRDRPWLTAFVHFAVLCVQDDITEVDEGRQMLLIGSLFVVFLALIPWSG